MGCVGRRPRLKWCRISRPEKRSSRPPPNHLNGEMRHRELRPNGRWRLVAACSRRDRRPQGWLRSERAPWRRIHPQVECLGCGLENSKPAVPADSLFLPVNNRSGCCARGGCDCLLGAKEGAQETWRQTWRPRAGRARVRCAGRGLDGCSCDQTPLDPGETAKRQNEANGKSSRNYNAAGEAHAFLHRLAGFRQNGKTNLGGKTQ
jgi:hypothetical protein